jgi:hypothetical protein
MIAGEKTQAFENPFPRSLILNRLARKNPETISSKVEKTRIMSEFLKANKKYRSPNILK